MSAGPDPLVSIIIPVYNGSNYLREAIDSALAQTYQNVEVLVVNDGSTDGGRTESVARAYGARIRYFEKKNGGVSSALNLGIKEMKGEYFCWLSHDDAYYPHKIRNQVEHLKNSGEGASLYSDYDYIDEHSKFLFTEKVEHYSPDNLLFALLYYTPINGCTVMIPKKILDSVGMFNESLRTTQDIDMWFRIARKNDFLHMPESLVKSRVHLEQGCWTISGHLIEQQKLRTSFLEQVPPQKLLRISGEKTVSAACLKLALRLKMERNYGEAAGKALSIMEGHLDELRPLSRIKFRLVAFYCRKFDRKLSLMYWTMIFKRLVNSHFLKTYLKSLRRSR